MDRYIVEVLDCDPDLESVIVPTYERIVERPSAATVNTLDQALFIYATGDSAPLVRMLEESQSACQFIVGNFEAEWFIRAESASDSSCEARTSSMCSAVAIAHAILNRTAARAALSD